MWELDGSLWVYTGVQWISERPLAMFDFDSTLHPYRGKGPPVEQSCALVAILAKTANRNVVIFSNRSSDDFSALQPLRDFVALVESEGCSCDVYAATARDRNRKPQRGGWERFLTRRGPLTPFQLGASFFCGDAAGRETDFSVSDRYFAVNIGVRFYVPEQIFGTHAMSGAAPLAEKWSIETELALAAKPQKRAVMARVLDRAVAYDVVMMVGSPASGKSFFARRLAENGFQTASQDLQGTKSRCMAFLAAEIAKPGSRVVVDNTHRTEAVRAEYVTVARKARRDIRVAFVWVTTPRLVCLHLDGLRCDSDPSGGTPLLHRLAIPSYWKNFEPPEEGGRGGHEVFVLDFAWDPDTPSEIFEKRYA